MKGFVDRINPANHSADHNRKLLTWQGKATVILYSVLKQYHPMQHLLDGSKKGHAEKACQGRNQEKCK